MISLKDFKNVKLTESRTLQVSGGSANEQNNFILYSYEPHRGNIRIKMSSVYFPIQ